MSYERAYIFRGLIIRPSAAINEIDVDASRFTKGGSDFPVHKILDTAP